MPIKKKPPSREAYWPTVVVLSLVITSLTTIYLVVPDHRTDIVYAGGMLGAALLAWMRSLRK